MATLTNGEKGKLNRAVFRIARDKGVAVSWTKAQLGTVWDAIESYAEDTPQNKTVRQGTGLAIESAAPGVFSATQKGYLWAAWSVDKARREGIGVGLVLSALEE